MQTFMLMTGDVAEALEQSPAVLQQTIRRAGLKPSVREADGQGSRQLWSFSDVLAIRCLLRMRVEGLPTERVRVALTALGSYVDKLHAAGKRGLEDVPAGTFLLLEGMIARVLERADGGGPRDVLRRECEGKVQLAFDISQMSRKLQGFLEKDRKGKN